MQKKNLPPVPNGQYQDGQNTNQNFLHCVSSFEGTSYKTCKIQSLYLLFLVVLISFYISRPNNKTVSKEAPEYDY